jgi:hypothetical protein
VYTVDPHLEQRGITGEQYGPADMVELYKNIAKAPMPIPNLVYCLCVSGAEAARGMGSESVGLLWIDALHETSAVMSDFLSWRHTLANTALLGFHDSNYSTVQEAISGIQKRGYKLQPIVKGGSIMIFTFTRSLWPTN